jgi:hypothetical protein
MGIGRIQCRWSGRGSVRSWRGAEWVCAMVSRMLRSFEAVMGRRRVRAGSGAEGVRSPACIMRRARAMRRRRRSIGAGRRAIRLTAVMWRARRATAVNVLIRPCRKRPRGLAGGTITGFRIEPSRRWCGGSVPGNGSVLVSHPRFRRATLGQHQIEEAWRQQVWAEAGEGRGNRGYRPDRRVGIRRQRQWISARRRGSTRSASKSRGLVTLDRGGRRSRARG